jgi:hypothetical protein
MAVPTSRSESSHRVVRILDRICRSVAEFVQFA